MLFLISDCEFEMFKGVVIFNEMVFKIGKKDIYYYLNDF